MVNNLGSEIWCPINGYDDYQISNFARVKSLKRGREKILCQKLCNSNGYFYIGLCRDNKVKTFSVHRLVAQAFIPNPDNKPQVNHINGIKTDNRVENLEWVTREENAQHARQNGLLNPPHDEEHIKAKLTNKQVLYIRQNPTGLSLEQLAKKFNVTDGTISAIQLGQRYKTAGGNFRCLKVQRIPDNVRAKIRAEYQKGGVGQCALAKKFRISSFTVWKIVTQQN